ncbi:hypothetical protein D3874_07910 [Oleomonas cavernae]|uniref:Flagellar protein FliL n=1 Tax=Oleomonas cavernae TaxID=2320859 RepID=A0A418WA86_9PROT|nr:hypothetical protein D3874_07910 [Oleomonas cavernae]
MVAVLVLAVLGFGGLYLGGFILAGPDTQMPPPAPVATLPTVPDVAYLELKNVILPANRGGQFRNYINFTFKIEVKDEATAQTLKEREVYMRAALVGAFSTEPIETKTGPADFDDAVFRARVLAELVKVAGPDLIQGVLIERVLPIKG